MAWEASAGKTVRRIRVQPGIEAFVGSGKKFKKCCGRGSWPSLARGLRRMVTLDPTTGHSTVASLDNLVGALQHRLRHREAERPAGFGAGNCCGRAGDGSSFSRIARSCWTRGDIWNGSAAIVAFRPRQAPLSRLRRVLSWSSLRPRAERVACDLWTGIPQSRSFS